MGMNSKDWTRIKSRRWEKFLTTRLLSSLMIAADSHQQFGRNLRRFCWMMLKGSWATTKIWWKDRTQYSTGTSSISTVLKSKKNTTKSLQTFPTRNLWSAKTNVWSPWLSKSMEISRIMMKGSSTLTGVPENNGPRLSPKYKSDCIC